MFTKNFQINLKENEVHVWIANTDFLFDKYPSYKKLLVEQETKRAEQFIFHHLRMRFTIARGILRDLLSHYLNQKNETIKFAYGELGKPHLLENLSDLQFNVSHSSQIAVFGITKGKEIGVDVEEIKKNFSCTDLGNYIFNDSEKIIFKKINIHQQTLSFFNAWTRKEAVLKGLGTGLSKPPTDIEVTFSPSEPPKILGIVGDPKNNNEEWSLQAIDFHSDYTAAVAIKSPRFKLKLFQYIEPLTIV